MKKIKLEDLNKPQVFTKPPEGYFDRLPGIIQCKTAHKSSGSGYQVVWIRALKLVPAAAVLALIVFYSGLFSRQDAVPGFDALLSEVSSEDIILYLQELEISNDEILEEVDLAALSPEFENIEDPLLNNLEIEDESLIQLYEEYNLQDSLL